MENNFIWTDDKVMEFAIKWLNDRVKWAVMHDFAAAPMPIQMELKNFKDQYSRDWAFYEIHDAGGVRLATPEDNANCVLNNASLFSVKRLSDGEVFRKGDIIRYTGTEHPIHYFTIYNGYIYVNQHYVSQEINIDSWIKVTQ